MDRIAAKDLPKLFEGAAEIFAEKKEELCALDARMGDGDLGLTMNKGYAALPGLIRDNLDEEDIGKTLMKAGMKMASLVPSTMGTLMAGGMMEGGKLLKGKTSMGPEELTDYLNGFTEGIRKRGKCSPGDRTILDAMAAGAERASIRGREAGATLTSIMEAAVEGAGEGVEVTKQMVPKYGKAAVFAARAIGTADQGAIAGLYMLMGLLRSIRKLEE